ncbi:MAG: polA [Actinobacteria bacterium]|nr:polA [Actinomycetota bacterium]MEA2534846.1 polymerase [Actinomycetota bacterium]
MPPSSKTSAPTVLLLDGHSLAYRAFFALAEADLRTTSGQPTNAVYGFTSMLIKAWQDAKSRYLAVAFDRGAPLERLAIRPEYKAQRQTPPDEFRQQVGLIREVLKVLQVPVFEMDNVEADDIIHVLGSQLAAEGATAVVVTADRDFFQMVGPRVRVVMNRRGISDTVTYDEAAVRQRYGFGPERYLDYAALRGDPSDNIEGVPGIGEKTAAKLVQTYGTLEAIFEHLDELPPKNRERLGEAQTRLLENREFFRFRSREELAAHGAPVEILDVSAKDLQMGRWDAAEVRRLFDSLEFRTLYERLGTDLPAAAPQGGLSAEAAEVTGIAELEAAFREAARSGVVTMRVAGEKSHPRSAPTSLAVGVPGGARAGARVARLENLGSDPEAVWAAIREPLASARLATHASKDALLRLAAADLKPAGIAMDTEIAAYLVDPARGSYPLDELVAQYLGRELRLEAEPVEGQQALLLDAAGGPADEGAGADLALGAEVVAVSELATLLEKELVERGAWDLLVDLELPLAAVLARVERAGVRLDTDYLAELSEAVGDELRTIEHEIYNHAGEPFNIGSPPQLRRILYEKLALKPTKRTKTGFSTDASVLESLREEHPIVDAILRYRERSKLKSTYLDALPPLVDATTGRLHCRFNQTVASTGRLSSDSPNLQNIPIRTEDGRRIRRAFVPEPGNLLVVADYSQIELRVLAHLSEDPELVSAFARGEDIHRHSISKALGIPLEAVTGELRSIGKMVSYGVTYGMGPFGLAQRLHIPMDQARIYIEGFFASYPRVRDYLDAVVAQAKLEGYTTTILGRRRYLPDLNARNPAIRSNAERMALNAPIQGSAADIIKLAMVKADEALEGRPGRMVLTVHDELVFEVPETEVEAVAEEMRTVMEGVLDLRVPLKVDLAWGRNWADAKS